MFDRHAFAKCENMCYSYTEGKTRKPCARYEKI